ncbi:hypothetical protein GLAREA_00199 [Glarea lozoyensis ATCC 20868]|uniref:Uncharacterized protein n=1 Tax=Glarea lozoyensis (strain ATCC 20868 / MF5171) TaxID=1116229 RepID=S3DAN3_GLAL2|nr:uncharacterized protein GLAREA_00199 [Glarea lozoyensis ATCC 20868]EPE29041.1 hypothetical protein GLAREA_00199 [Glarea lozoyensis ATCC 20868]
MDNSQNMISDAEANGDEFSLNTLMKATRLTSSTAVDNVASLPSLPKDTGDENAFLNEFLGRDVLRLWEALKVMTGQHEVVIRSLWSKKNRNERVRILTKAWGIMPAGHSPDMTQYKKDVYALRGGEYRPEGNVEAFAFPHINIEDLRTPKPFLLLVESRSRYHPNEFLQHDLEAARFGVDSGRIVLPCMTGYKIDLVDIDGSYYGRLWNHTTKPLQNDHDWYSFHFSASQAVFALQLQHRLLNFILRACKVIVGEKRSLHAGHSVLKSNELPSCVERKVGAWWMVSIENSEKPYSAPKKLDLAQLKNIFLARKQYAEDHVLHLRDDQHFFLYTLKRQYDFGHMLLKASDLLLKTSKVSHPTTWGERGSWAVNLCQLIENTHITALVWTSLCSHLERLTKSVQRFENRRAKAISPCHISYDFFIFHGVLDLILQGLAEELYNAFVASSGNAAFVQHNVIGYVKQPELNDTARSSAGAYRDQLFGHIGRLAQKEVRNRYGCTRLVKDIERLLVTDCLEKKFFTPYTSEIFSEIGLFATAMEEISLFQPLAARLYEEYSYKEATFERAMEKIFALPAYVQKSLRNHAFAKLYNSHFPGEDELQFRGLHSSDSIKQITEPVEEKLEKFWNAADQIMQAEIGETLLDLVDNRVYPQPDVQQSSSEKTEMNNQICNAKELDRAGLFDGNELSKLGNRVSSTRESRTERILVEEGVDKKMLARLQISTTVIPNGTLMSNRVSKIFEALFYNYERNSGKQPRGFSWPEFCFAMHAIGFNPRKQYGTLWHFQKDARGCATCFQFHEPLETNKVPLMQMRFMGGSLHRQFGWSLDNLPTQKSWVF